MRSRSRVSSVRLFLASSTQALPSYNRTVLNGTVIARDEAVVKSKTLGACYISDQRVYQAEQVGHGDFKGEVASARAAVGGGQSGDSSVIDDLHARVRRDRRDASCLEA